MADDAEQERKAKAERAKKLLAAQKKKKKAAAAAAVAAGDSTSQAPSSEAPDSPRPSFDERRATATPTIPSTSTVAEEPGSSSIVSIPTAVVDTQGPSDLAPPPNEESDGGAVEVTVGPNDITSSKQEKKGKKKVAPSVASSSGEVDALKTTNATLVKDKLDLTARISSLESTISLLQTEAGLLKEARAENKRLEEECQHQISEIASQSAQLTDLQGLKAELESTKTELEATDEKAKMGDKDVERLTEEVKKLKQEMERKEAAVKAQTADLENRLNRQRDREGGLEAEVARLKQVNIETANGKKEAEKAQSELKTKLDEALSALSASQISHDTLLEQHRELVDSHSTAQSSSSSLQKDLDAAKKARASAETHAEQLQEALATASASASSLQKQLDAQTKRAEQAATQRKGLLEDNESMMSQLEEMRATLGPLMEAKLLLVEAKEAGEKAIRELEDARKQAESAKAELEQLRSTHLQSETEVERLRKALVELELSQAHFKQVEDVEAQHQGRVQSLEKELESTQAKYNDISSELERSRKTTLDLNASYDSSLRTLAEAAQLPFDEDVDARQLLQTLVEKLVAIANSASKADSEVNDADSRQDHHTLEMSSLSARLRSTETALHDETSRAHSLARQLSDVQTEVARVNRERDEALRKIELGVGSSRGPTHAGGDGTALSSVPTMIAPRAPIDFNLPPSARHKRQVSLQALRARMGPVAIEERRPSASRRSTSGFSSLKEEEDGSTEQGEEGVIAANGHDHVPRQRGQFGDEVVFWCSACQGDLITL